MATSKRNFLCSNKSYSHGKEKTLAYSLFVHAEFKDVQVNHFANIFFQEQCLSQSSIHVIISIPS